jgi:hypothetical protein
MYEYTATQVGTHKLSQLRNYISLFRFHYHSSFIGILLGAFVITRDWHGRYCGASSYSTCR